MSVPLAVALGIIAFAAAFHLHWAFGGKIGHSVSLPQRGDGHTVLAHQIGWWRWGSAGVAIGLGMVAAMALSVAGFIQLPLPPSIARGLLVAIGVAFVLRSIVPTPWTGFFKSIRTTRWAKYDTRLYSPLFLVLGLSLIVLSRN